MTTAKTFRPVANANLITISNVKINKTFYMIVGRL